jgi:predicted alpha-1,2-mannosidase
MADRAAAILADAVGRRDEAEMFRARSFNYTNNWCEKEGRFLPRKANGSFVPRSQLAKPYSDYCEQSPETATWTVPYDTDGLVKLLGGKHAAIRRLDEYFDTLFWQPERGNKSIHGNQPSHHTSYLYNRFGEPEKTQFRVREIMTRSYSTDRKGFDGNEDCGQMSAWYILSALGFYPLDTISGEYEIGSPMVRYAKIEIGSPFKPATFEIKVKNYAPDRWRVKRVSFNGRELKDFRIRHSDMISGGVLEFEMDAGKEPPKSADCH